MQLTAGLGNVFYRLMDLLNKTIKAFGKLSDFIIAFHFNTLREITIPSAQIGKAFGYLIDRHSDTVSQENPHKNKDGSYRQRREHHTLCYSIQFRKHLMHRHGADQEPIHALDVNARYHDFFTLIVRRNQVEAGFVQQRTRP
ncbi:Uncharacterised protein [Vibrio cholerae]|nr:Uncharacterised protein [Vibrio cholerae]CSB56044.1 Uncharacterised protein [Vibrio cholerae]CSB83256.1 Uncharacterised protein [Vibrio cholerae]